MSSPPRLTVQAWDHEQRQWVTLAAPGGDGRLGMVRVIGAGVRVTHTGRQHGKAAGQLDMAVDPLEGEATRLELVEVGVHSLQAQLRIRGVVGEP